MRAIVSVRGKWPCSRCRLYKPASAFHSCAAKTNGLASECRECRKRFVSTGYIRKAVHGITPEQYDGMVTAQAGRCACCGNPETRISAGKDRVKGLAVDHDHATGQIRGLLCMDCNLGLGHLGDDPVRLLQAFVYLCRHKPSLPQKIQELCGIIQSYLLEDQQNHQENV